jgi:CBS domain-containing protein
MKTIRQLIGEREVYAIDASQTVAEAVAYLCERGIGAVAVMEGDALAGVFSERDLMRRVVWKKRDPELTPITDVMTRDVFYVDIDQNFAVAKALMLDKNFRHLVVLDENKQLRGFVSMRELLEADISESRELIRKLNDSYYEHQFQRPESER